MEITLTFHNTPLQCYSELDDTFDNYENINKVLKRLNLYLQDILRSYKIDLNISLLVADSVSLSPATILRDSIFYVAFPAKLFSYFKERIAKIYSIPEFQKYFNFKEECMDQYIVRTFDWICNCALLHEIFHIVNGHLKYKLEIQKNQNKVSTKIKNYNLEFQTMEFDADYNASVKMAKDLISIVHNPDMRKNYSASYLLQYILDDFIFLNVALCISFSTFQDNKSLKNGDYLSIDHPIEAIRYSYATEILINEFLKSFNGIISSTKLISKISEITIACNRIYYADNKFSDSLVCSAYSEQAVKHKMLVHNNWNNIYKTLNKYAYVELFEKEELTELSYWVDEDKNILPIAFKI